MKKFAALICAVVLALGIGAGCFAEDAETVDIRILATSDLHGWFVPHDFAIDEDSAQGSLTFIATLIAGHRSSHKYVILVDCGDAVQANRGVFH